jgi:hypothetical protein
VLIELCNRLVKINSEKLKKMESMENRVNDMMKISFGEDGKRNLEGEKDKQIKVSFKYLNYFELII